MILIYRPVGGRAGDREAGAGGGGWWFDWFRSFLLSRSLVAGVALDIILLLHLVGSDKHTRLSWLGGKQQNIPWAIENSRFT